VTTRVAPYVAPLKIDPKAASWNRPWRAGNPQANSLGESSQVLDRAHAPAHASAVYWLGGPFGGLYPYARAMRGGDSEPMLSIVVYADRRNVEPASFLLTAWDTRSPNKGYSSEGAMLATNFQRFPVRQLGGRAWVDTSANTGGGSEALVLVGAHTLLQVVRIDERAPNLSKIVAALRPY
jgi:hypothetical protein